MGTRITATSAGHDLVDWIGHQMHNEGTIPEWMALEIRAAIVVIEDEAHAKGAADSQQIARAAQAVLDWTEKERWAGPHDWLQHALTDWNGRSETDTSGSTSTSETNAANGSSSAESSSGKEPA